MISAISGRKKGKILKKHALRGRDERLGCIEDRVKIGKKYMEKIIDEDNKSDEMEEIDEVKGPVARAAKKLSK